MPLAEIQAIHEEILRDHADAAARVELLNELYPGWDERYPGLACALKRLSSTLLISGLVFEEVAEEVAMRTIVESVGCTLEGGPTC